METSVRLLTHESFALSEDVLAAFTAETGIEVEVLRGGDAGSVVNQAILTKPATRRATCSSASTPRSSPAASTRSCSCRTSRPSWTASTRSCCSTPSTGSPRSTCGDVCLNYDREFFEAEGAPPVPDDPRRPRPTPPTATSSSSQDPATSSPGLAFLAGTIAELGEDGWEDYWTSLRANGVEVADGWADAYYGSFSGGAASEGDRPARGVVRVEPAGRGASSPNPPIDEAPTGVIEGTCVRQVEYAGVLAGAEHPEAARAAHRLPALARGAGRRPAVDVRVPGAWTGIELPDVFVEHAEVGRGSGRRRPLRVRRRPRGRRSSAGTSWSCGEARMSRRRAAGPRLAARCRARRCSSPCCSRGRWPRSSTTGLRPDGAVGARRRPRRRCAATPTPSPSPAGRPRCPPPSPSRSPCPAPGRSPGSGSPGARPSACWSPFPFVLPTVVVATAFRGLVGRGGLLAGRVELDDSLAAIVARPRLLQLRRGGLDRGRAVGPPRPAGRGGGPGAGRLPLGASSGGSRIPLLWPVGPRRGGARSSCSRPRASASSCCSAGPSTPPSRSPSPARRAPLLDLPAAAALSLLQLVAVGALLVVHARLRERCRRPRPPGRPRTAAPGAPSVGRRAARASSPSSVRPCVLLGAPAPRARRAVAPGRRRLRARVVPPALAMPAGTRSCSSRRSRPIRTSLGYAAVAAAVSPW